MDWARRSRRTKHLSTTPPPLRSPLPPAEWGVCLAPSRQPDLQTGRQLTAQHRTRRQPGAWAARRARGGARRQLRPPPAELSRVLRGHAARPPTACPLLPRSRFAGFFFPSTPSFLKSYPPFGPSPDLTLTQFNSLPSP